jgi:hypothetical protein
MQVYVASLRRARHILRDHVGSPSVAYRRPGRVRTGTLIRWTNSVAAVTAHRSERSVTAKFSSGIDETERYGSDSVRLPDALKLLNCNYYYMVQQISCLAPDPGVGNGTRIAAVDTSLSVRLATTLVPGLAGVPSSCDDATLRLLDGLFGGDVARRRQGIIQFDESTV